MNAGSVTQQKAAIREPESSVRPQNFVAFYINPVCEHKWSKLATDLQTLASEGKTIWQCSTCTEISTTYDWKKPEG